MPKKKLPKTIMYSSFVLMKLINIFSIKFSSIALMLIAGIISLSIFCMNKGGTKS